MKYKLLAILVLFCFSCQNNKEPKPSKIFYGEDICESCKMIISESEFAAQYVLQNHEIKKFDEIGCMVQFINKNENLNKIKALYVKDFVLHNWIDGKNAYYIKNEKIKTPMGHSILAFENSKEAERYQNEFLGSLTELQQFLQEE